ncbi:hypothetical protein JCM11641_000138 [Rhodosporidiobolus odoratus]
MSPSTPAPTGSDDMHCSDWKVHKAACTAFTINQPFVVHIDLRRGTTDHAPWCKDLLDSISTPHAKTHALATSASKALAIMNHPFPPKSVLFTMGDIAESTCAELRTKLRQYIEEGGRLVFGGPIANFVNMQDIDSMFSDFGAPKWK